MEAASGNHEAAKDTQEAFMNGPGLAHLAIPASVLAAPWMLAWGIAAAGFSEGGIVIGSAATNLMSVYGGRVAAGSLCAVLQSWGAAGVPPAVAGISAVVGGAVGAAVGAVARGGGGDDMERVEAVGGGEEIDFVEAWDIVEGEDV